MTDKSCITDAESISESRTSRRNFLKPFSSSMMIDEGYAIHDDYSEQYHN